MPFRRIEPGTWKEGRTPGALDHWATDAYIVIVYSKFIYKLILCMLIPSLPNFAHVIPVCPVMFQLRKMCDPNILRHISLLFMNKRGC